MPTEDKLVVDNSANDVEQNATTILVPSSGESSIVQYLPWQDQQIVLDQQIVSEQSGGNQPIILNGVLAKTIPSVSAQASGTEAKDPEDSGVFSLGSQLNVVGPLSSSFESPPATAAVFPEGGGSSQNSQGAQASVNESPNRVPKEPCAADKIFFDQDDEQQNAQQETQHGTRKHAQPAPASQQPSSFYAGTAAASEAAGQSFLNSVARNTAVKTNYLAKGGIRHGQAPNKWADELVADILSPWRAANKTNGVKWRAGTRPGRSKSLNNTNTQQITSKRTPSGTGHSHEVVGSEARAVLNWKKNQPGGQPYDPFTARKISGQPAKAGSAQGQATNANRVGRKGKEVLGRSQTPQKTVKFKNSQVIKSGGKGARSVPFSRVARVLQVAALTYDVASNLNDPDTDFKQKTINIVVPHVAMRRAVRLGGASVLAATAAGDAGVAAYEKLLRLANDKSLPESDRQTYAEMCDDVAPLAGIGYIANGAFELAVLCTKGAVDKILELVEQIPFCNTSKADIVTGVHYAEALQRQQQSPIILNGTRDVGIEMPAVDCPADLAKDTKKEADQQTNLSLVERPKRVTASGNAPTVQFDIKSRGQLQKDEFFQKNTFADDLSGPYEDQGFLAGATSSRNRFSPEARKTSKIGKVAGKHVASAEKRMLNYSDSDRSSPDDLIQACSDLGRAEFSVRTSKCGEAAKQLQLERVWEIKDGVRFAIQQRSISEQDQAKIKSKLKDPSIRLRPEDLSLCHLPQEQLNKALSNQIVMECFSGEGSAAKALEFVGISQVDSDTVSVLFVCLRSDVYKQYSPEEKSKLRSRCLALEPKEKDVVLGEMELQLFNDGLTKQTVSTLSEVYVCRLDLPKVSAERLANFMLVATTKSTPQLARYNWTQKGKALMADENISEEDRKKLSYEINKAEHTVWNNVDYLFSLVSTCSNISARFFPQWRYLQKKWVDEKVQKLKQNMSQAKVSALASVNSRVLVPLTRCSPSIYYFTISSRLATLTNSLNEVDRSSWGSWRAGERGTGLVSISYLIPIVQAVVDELSRHISCIRDIKDRESYLRVASRTVEWLIILSQLGNSIKALLSSGIDARKRFSALIKVCSMVPGLMYGLRILIEEHQSSLENVIEPQKLEYCKAVLSSKPVTFVNQFVQPEYFILKEVMRISRFYVLSNLPSYLLRFELPIQIRHLPENLQSKLPGLPLLRNFKGNVFSGSGLVWSFFGLKIFQYFSLSKTGAWLMKSEKGLVAEIASFEVGVSELYPDLNSFEQSMRQFEHMPYKRFQKSNKSVQSDTFESVLEKLKIGGVNNENLSDAFNLIIALNEKLLIAYRDNRLEYVQSSCKPYLELYQRHFQYQLMQLFGQPMEDDKQFEAVASKIIELVKEAEDDYMLKDARVFRQSIGDYARGAFDNITYNYFVMQLNKIKRCVLDSVSINSGSWKGWVDEVDNLASRQPGDGPLSNPLIESADLSVSAALEELFKMERSVIIHIMLIKISLKAELRVSYDQCEFRGLISRSGSDFYQSLARDFQHDNGASNVGKVLAEVINDDNYLPAVKKAAEIVWSNNVAKENRVNSIWETSLASAETELNEVRGKRIVTCQMNELRREIAPLLRQSGLYKGARQRFSQQLHRSADNLERRFLNGS